MTQKLGYVVCRECHPSFLQGKGLLRDESGNAMSASLGVAVAGELIYIARFLHQ